MLIKILSQNTVWHLKQLVAILFSAIILLWVYPKTNLDSDLIAPYFDADNQVFNLKHDIFLNQVMHIGLRNFVISLALITLFLTVLSKQLKLSALVRRQLSWSLIGMILSTLAVSLLKSQSLYACPWDLTDFGGSVLYYPMLARVSGDVTGGYCWPGWHGSGGFGLMAFYFASRLTYTIFAFTSLMSSLTLDFVMGWSQMIRGAHFLSHNLWVAGVSLVGFYHIERIMHARKR